MDTLKSNVNHPSHYNSHPSGVECINIVEHFNFNVGNAVKYLWRAGLKPNAPLFEDLEKAKFYIDREISRLAFERGKVGLQKKVCEIHSILGDNCQICKMSLKEISAAQQR